MYFRTSLECWQFLWCVICPLLITTGDKTCCCDCKIPEREFVQFIWGVVKVLRVIPGRKVFLMSTYSLQEVKKCSSVSGCSSVYLISQSAFSWQPGLSMTTLLYSQVTIPEPVPVLWHSVKIRPNDAGRIILVCPLDFSYWWLSALYIWLMIFFYQTGVQTHTPTYPPHTHTSMQPLAMSHESLRTKGH